MSITKHELFCVFCRQKTKDYKFVENKLIKECLKCGIGYTFPPPQNDSNQEELGYSEEKYILQTKKLSTRFQKIINKILKYKSKGRYLDIGCGFGLFTSELYKVSNFKITVIEPFLNPILLKNKNIQIVRSPIEDVIKDNKFVNYFDVISMLDVLEHLRDMKTLSNIKKLCKKNALVVIQVPNYKSIMAKICNYWSWWMVKDHTVHFSIKSIKELLNKSGFQVLDTTTYEDFVDFKKNLDGNFMFIKHGKTRKITKGIIYLLFFPIYYLFRPILWRLGLGGLILVIAKIKK